MADDVAGETFDLRNKVVAGETGEGYGRESGGAFSFENELERMIDLRSRRSSAKPREFLRRVSAAALSVPGVPASTSVLSWSVYIQRKARPRKSQWLCTGRRGWRAKTHVRARCRRERNRCCRARPSSLANPRQLQR